MKISRFEDIEAWKEARLLTNEIYCLLADCRDFGFRDQIQRAALSIMANIAEGFDRHTNKEFIQYLVVSRGSAAEVKSFLYAANDIGYITQDKFQQLYSRCTKISNLLNGFIRYLRNTPRKH
jgi:four helix bundle protein